MNSPIKQAIFEELNKILRTPGQQNEERLQQLKFTEEFPICLCEICLDDSLLDQIGLRQLASVLLKKYVDEHWVQDEQEYDPTKLLASEPVKNAIKSMLPKGLYCSNSKIRTSIAYTISAIAAHDWPTDWTELFDIIVKCLAGNEDSVHGAMQVLVEFTYELEERVRDVGPVILSEVYRIFDPDQGFCVKTRSCAVDILNSLLKCTHTHIEPKDQSKILDPVMPAFMEKMIQSLALPIGPSCNFTLKTEVMKIFTYMINEMPKRINSFMPRILPPLWSLLTNMADVYIKSIVNEGEMPDPFDGDEGDFNICCLVSLDTIYFSLIFRRKSQFYKNDFANFRNDSCNS